LLFGFLLGKSKGFGKSEEVNYGFIVQQIGKHQLAFVVWQIGRH
jgi:hypothetical protein